MPSSSPVMTVPTTFPRCVSGARVAAAGTMSCASVAARPITGLAASKVPTRRAMLPSSRASMSMKAFARMIPRRS